MKSKSSTNTEILEKTIHTLVEKQHMINELIETIKLLKKCKIHVLVTRRRTHYYAICKTGNTKIRVKIDNKPILKTALVIAFAINPSRIHKTDIVMVIDTLRTIKTILAYSKLLMNPEVQKLVSKLTLSPTRMNKDSNNGNNED